MHNKYVLIWHGCITVYQVAQNLSMFLLIQSFANICCTFQITYRYTCYRRNIFQTNNDRRIVRFHGKIVRQLHLNCAFKIPVTELFFSIFHMTQSDFPLFPTCRDPTDICPLTPPRDVPVNWLLWYLSMTQTPPLPQFNRSTLLPISNRWQDSSISLIAHCRYCSLALGHRNNPVHVNIVSYRDILRKIYKMLMFLKK